MELDKESFSSLVMTVQEPVEVEKAELKQIKLRTLLESKGVFERLECSAETFFTTHALIVNGAAVNTLDAYVDQEADVVALPRIRGG
jgi:hypothetical protein